MLLARTSISVAGGRRNVTGSRWSCLLRDVLRSNGRLVGSFLRWAALSSGRSRGRLRIRLSGLSSGPLGGRRSAGPGGLSNGRSPEDERLLTLDSDTLLKSRGEYRRVGSLDVREDSGTGTVLSPGR